MRPLMKVLMFSTALALTGCSDGSTVFSSSPSSGTQQRADKAAGSGYYKVGNPYQVAGIWYYPKEDYAYKEVGVSSWYGADFHNGITANGELYDMHAVTAAHRTLPLPSVVRVTNLQNGRSLVLRVNDRGPFVNERIIDVSMRAAQLLGFKEQGTTQVQVEILPEESKALKEELLAAQNGNKAVAASAAAVGLDSEAIEDTVNRPAPPKNLAYSPNLPRLANQPPAMLDAPLVSEGAAETNANRYNDWDDDLTKPQAQRTAFETANQKVEAIPAVKKQPLAPAARKEPVPQAAPKTAAPVVTTTAIAPGYYVQVGAFGSEENAEKMRANVSKYGSALIIPVTVNGKSLYRVRLGPSNAKMALEMMDKVTNAGFTDARLVEEKGSDMVGQRLDRAF